MPNKSIMSLSRSLTSCPIKIAKKTWKWLTGLFLPSRGRKADRGGEREAATQCFMFLFLSRNFPFLFLFRLNFIRPKLRTWRESREGGRERERESGNIRKLIRYEISVCSPPVHTKQKALAQLLVCEITHSMPSMVGTSSFKPLRR